MLRRHPQWSPNRWGPHPHPSELGTRGGRRPKRRDPTLRGRQSDGKRGGVPSTSPGGCPPAGWRRRGGCAAGFHHKSIASLWDVRRTARTDTGGSTPLRCGKHRGRRFPARGSTPRARASATAPQRRPRRQPLQVHAKDGLGADEQRRWTRLWTVAVRLGGDARSPGWFISCWFRSATDTGNAADGHSPRCSRRPRRHDRWGVARPARRAAGR